MKVENLQDIYELSPAQQGILFHSLYTPESGVYFLQLHYTLQGYLDVSAFEQAWQKVIARHPALRTSFHWEDLEKPLQVVHQHIKVPLVQHDLQKLSPSEQQEHLQTLLEIDRQGFDLSEAPLMRLNLLQLGEKSYQFIWSKHHLILDGWSTALVLKEVVEIYAALSQGQQEPDLPISSYGDYIAWLQQQDLSKAEAFWREKLKGFNPFTKRLGLDVSSRLQKDCNQQVLQLSSTTTAALQSLARQHQLTLNTLVQGAWALLLSRRSGENDVVYGATVSGRPADLAGAESMVGLLINTLPVRVQVKPEQPLLAWLKQLQAQLVEMRQYEYSPLVEVQGWSEVPRGQPLFESILVFENYPVDRILQEWKVNLEIQNFTVFEKTNYPLTVFAIPGSELELRILYDCCCFDAAEIIRMLNHFQTLLAGMATNPQQRLCDLPLLTEAEVHQQLVEWNNQKADYPKECLHQLFEAQVERTPDAIAVVFEDEKLTYRELNEQANKIAHYLLRLGVRTEELVGISVERSLHTIIGIFGILKAGAAYVPLDPAYPSDRLAFMLNDAQVSVLLTHSALKDRYSDKIPSSCRSVCLDTDWDRDIAQESFQNPTNRVTSDNLAYVIYTSGSTGTPKGVLGRHQGAVNRCYWAAYPFNTDDICCQKTSLNFVDSVWEIFAPLLHGLRTVIIADEVVKDPYQLVQTLSEQQVTRIILVPSLLRVILDTFADLSSRLPKLKYWVSSGEALSIELCQRFRQRMPQSRLINLYGSSEVSADVTWYDTTENALDSCVSIGRPIANTCCFLLDSNLQLVPIGVPGELYIGGDGLARGYLNQPELTAEKFIPNPFNQAIKSQKSKDSSLLVSSDRLYKTGDLGRYLPTGDIEFLGRLDHQVKIRGYRIEVGEIEALLVQHPAVQEAVVLTREDETGDKRLVAYVVPDDQLINSKSSQLRQFLKEKLPEYMVPSAFVILPVLPLTPNGKVDRNSLPAPETFSAERETVFVAPQTQTEKELAEIWSAVLGVQAGIYDNFFDLGGHSLIATQLLSRVRTNFGVDISLRNFFASSTIKNLAEMVEEALLLSSSTDIDKMLDQLEGLEEDEIQKILIDCQNEGN
ncbi:MULTISPECIES: non-ribosomal peptide synthetase [Cyanophyceae]|uniref:non-ribosomal peptide synthetase n=1 Tax=Cyanophyceae TaxID=3028117 RepID=UPI001683E9EE|nr:non-ribosomal peptide synthetase [Trichocoleus sp. FACHB-40]MBD2002946.1 amino acid adenylation domain-containing protein [Trichocoleus sp. FACHB-40]